MPEPTKTRPGVALIGAGMIAPTHVAALSALQDRLRLTAVVSRTPDRAAPLAALYQGPAPRFAADLAAVTDDPDVAFAIVATPPSVRLALIERLAKAGKHILLEKPLARSRAEAAQVVEICETHGVTLGMVFQLRTLPAARAAAERIASGSLGTLGLVEIAAPLWRDQSYYDELGRGTYARDGGGVMLTQAIHTIDLALSLAAPATGPVTRVQAMTATTPLHRMEAEDYAVAGLTFASGAVGSLIASTATFPAGPETIALHFENASLRHSRHALEIAWRDGRVDRESFGAAEPGESGPVVADHGPHQAVIADFAEALRDRRPPMVTGRAGLAAHRLIDAIERASRTGAAADVAAEPNEAWTAQPPAIKALRRALSRALDDPDWITLGRLGAARLDRALKKEVGPGHTLHGQSVTAIARSTASDDVLFATDDGRLALVHLTYSGAPSGPDWPSTGFYASVEDFVGGLKAERTHVAALEKSFALGAEHPEGTLLCPSCGSDWGDAEARDDCPLCDGWALARPCPVCDGACGAIWTRAITDSFDEGTAIWIGKCQADVGSPPAT